MGVLGPRDSRRRPQYIGRVLMTRPTPHGIVGQLWAPPRGRISDTYQRSILDRFRALASHVARLNDREVAPLREAAARVSQAHTGLRGSASIRIEDLLTQLLSGRLFAWRVPGVGTLYHVDARLDASRALDWLEPTVGSILTRTDATWLPTDPCAQGAVCRLMHSAPAPGCCAPAAVHPNAV